MMAIKSRHSSIWVIGSLLVLGTLFTQATVIAQRPAPPQERQAADAALEALRTELEEAGRVWVKKYRAAASDEERNELRKSSSYRLFEPRYLDLARKYAGQPAAMEAAQWLASNANPGPVFDAALALVEEHHLEDNGIAKMCRTLAFRRTPGVEGFLLAVAKKHPKRDVQGLAYLSLARYLKEFHDFAVAMKENPDWLNKNEPGFPDEIVEWFRAADPDELAGRLAAVCEKIIVNYGELDDGEYLESVGETRTLADAAKSVTFSLEPIGKVAPETVGKGVGGSPVGLTDFRGQVIVLMFSADWCVPCKEMYGQLRELMVRYSDQPFTVMTVMADKTISTVRKAVDSGEITWPVIWDGDKGPIARDWNITAYPTIYLVDQEGRIRHRGLRDDALDDQVARMLGVDPGARAKVDKRTRVWDLSLRNKNLRGEELPKLLAGYTELRKLDLSHNPLADDALVHLQLLPKLETIDLIETGITDTGLQHLEKVANLKQVTLYLGPGHKTSKEGRRQLRRALPALTMSIVTHRSPSP